MNLNEDFFKERIVKLLEGNCSQQEAQEFLPDSPDVWDSYLPEKEWDDLIPGILPKEVSAGMFKKIQEGKEPVYRVGHWKRWINIAAIFILALATAFYFVSIPGKPRLETAKNEAGKVFPQSKEKHIENRSSHTEQYRLPDGSLVELSPASTLVYLEPMETSKRSIGLEGEGIFHVKKDPERPFTVYTPGFTTTVLETVFKITSFKDQTRSLVRLISGKVKVRNLKDTTQILYLKAGDQCGFDPLSQKLKMDQEQESLLTPAPHLIAKGAPQENKDEINFHNTPLPEVLHRLGMAYKIRLVFSSDSLATRKFTGNCKTNTTPEEAMEAILVLNDLQIKKAADTFYVMRK